MEAKATLNYTRISPRKVGLVLDLIRNKPVDLAAAILKHTPKAACEDLQKLLKSAVANAENNFNMDRNSLYVSQCYVTPGPILKRIGEGKRVSGKEANYGSESESPRSPCGCYQRLGFPLVRQGQRVWRHPGGGLQPAQNAEKAAVFRGCPEDRNRA